MLEQQVQEGSTTLHVDAEEQIAVAIGELGVVLDHDDRVAAGGKDFLTFDECERFLAAAREHVPDWFPYLEVAARTGLRVGEMLALRWREDIDLERGRLASPAVAQPQARDLDDQER